MSKFAKLYVPLALVSLVPRALRVLALYMPRAILDFVRQVLWCPHSLMSCAFPALVLYVTCILRAILRHLTCFLRSLLFYTTLPLYALVHHVPLALCVGVSPHASCLTCLVSYVPLYFMELFCLTYP